MHAREEDRSAKTLRVFFGPEVKTGACTADSGRAVNATDGETLGGASVICRGTAQLRSARLLFNQDQFVGRRGFCTARFNPVNLD